MTPTKPNKTPAKVHIIAGQYRRSVLPVANVPGLRPTPNRVRETLFNWIDHFWQGQYHDKTVLDLFAGTGALGFEAASRGVAHVQMVEPHPLALQQLRRTRDKLGVQQVRIHSHTAEMVLSRMDASRFDLLLLDPPFQSNCLQHTLPYLTQIAKPGALIYIESDNINTLAPVFTPLRQGKAGVVYFQLFQYTPNVDGL